MRDAPSIVINGPSTEQITLVKDIVFSILEKEDIAVELQIEAMKTIRDLIKNSPTTITECVFN